MAHFITFDGFSISVFIIIYGHPLYNNNDC
jgi:hypothetical protein